MFRFNNCYRKKGEINANKVGGRVGRVGRVGHIGQVRRVRHVGQVRRVGHVGQVRRVGRGDGEIAILGVEEV
ncbi:MAG TPA: hypothetical protein PLT82_01005 [Candidatus Hydrogenedens sp.]|nr:hypothetical protein [Candidatus Hydrogenedens sp.]HOL20504.1 hypothetical protein [Candidatus Hydrogenedens sp.]HPP57692.1 hypothetical protein [Candidatus Hydrogenedens sp.]